MVWRSLVAALVLWVGAVGQTPLPEAVAQRVASFFKLRIAGELEQAYARLRAGSPGEDSLEQERLQQLIVRYGLPVGYEILQTESVGKSLVQVVCLELYERWCVRWRFLFYRSPRRGWLLLRLQPEEEPEGFFRR